MGDLPDGLAFCTRDLCLRSVQYFLEFRDTEAHARMHVGFRTFDVVVEVVTEQLDVGDRGMCNIRLREMTREEH